MMKHAHLLGLFLISYQSLIEANARGVLNMKKIIKIDFVSIPYRG